MQKIPRYRLLTHALTLAGPESRMHVLKFFIPGTLQDLEWDHTLTFYSEYKVCNRLGTFIDVYHGNNLAIVPAAHEVSCPLFFCSNAPY